MEGPGDGRTTGGILGLLISQGRSAWETGRIGFPFSCWASQGRAGAFLAQEGLR